ncbi:unnamed protein product [Cuscuta epithymum]|uniref:F-box domain-containing protein n=1 Tax=Cuscuta epithymum TaxID=186058 RepID=A0AAV0D2X2_9ASTE|nr:unnamed protein product [Cuscuta epithymum]
METTAELPWDLIVQILRRLPVKDLLRYMCVSKSWCSLINGLDFINLHLKHIPESPSQLGFVSGDDNNLCWTASNDLDSFVRLTCPIDLGTGVSVLGSCNGLLAIMNPDSDMAIWNPFIRRYITLPISDHFQSIPEHEIHVFLTGFGHDPVTDDYKLMILIDPRERLTDTIHGEVKIYSVNGKSWKKIDDFPKHFDYHSYNGVLCGNALHWLVNSRRDNSYLILAFDLVTETAREIQLPLKHCPCLQLVNLEGSLCAVIYNVRFSYFEVWEMKEYGVKESWAMLSPLPTPPLLEFPFFKNGDHVLFHNCETLFLYDIKTKVSNKREVAGSDFPRICHARVWVCVKSLVGLHFSESTSNGKEHAATQ